MTNQSAYVFAVVWTTAWLRKQLHVLHHTSIKSTIGMSAGYVPYTATLASSVARTNPYSALRVKLVFVEEVARFVYRHRGFASCWYLVPASARLVGDLVHEIAREFELLQRCPDGLELLIEGFHVLPNQEIGLLRDGDTIAVQCTTFQASSIEAARDLPGPAIEKTKKKTKKRKEASNEDPAPVILNGKRKHPKLTKHTSVEEADVRTTNGTASRKRTLRVTVDPSDSSSGSSSSCSTSSEEEREEEAPAANGKKKAFRALVKQTAREMQEPATLPLADSNTADSSDTSSSSSSSSSDSDSDSAKQVIRVKKPLDAAKKTVQAPSETPVLRTRRRRRPRRRPKNDEATKKDSAKPAKATPVKLATPVIEGTAPPPRDIRPLRIRGAPPASRAPGHNHMRFDRPKNTTGNGAHQNEGSSSTDLSKYGPSTTAPKTMQRSSSGQDAHPSTSSRLHEEDRANSPADAPTRKKGYVDKWKRPYEIVSSIHDATTTSTAATKEKKTVDELVSAFPGKPADATVLPTPSGLQSGDVLAYKTLTLCMETWQPIVSEWLCGKVLDLAVDDDQILQPMSLSVGASQKLTWTIAANDVSAVLPLNELSELRYLDGPTFALLSALTTSPGAS